MLYKKIPFTALAFSIFSLIRSLIALKTASLFSVTDDDDDDEVDDTVAVLDFFTSFKSTYAPKKAIYVCTLFILSH